MPTLGVMRLSAMLILLLASCETTRQAGIATASATGVAVVGGYFEYRARSDGGGLQENVPISLVVGGTVAIASFVSMFFLDEIPRLDYGERWRPSDHRAGTELLAGLQRTTCYGSCPAYTVAVYRDGTVEFDGHAFVNVCGKAGGKISAEKVHELERQLDDAHVTAMDTVYGYFAIMHQPRAYLWFRSSSGYTKGIAHYLGDGSAPDGLLRAEKAVDEAANVEQWIGPHDKPFYDPICK